MDPRERISPQRIAVWVDGARGRGKRSPLSNPPRPFFREMSQDSCDKAAADGGKGPSAFAAEAWAIHTGFKCIVCDHTTEGWRALWKHMQTHDPVPNEEVVKDDSTGLLQCLVCGHQTRKSRDMRRHFAIHSTWSGFQCSKCPKRYKNSDAFLWHLSEAHEEEAGRVFKCEQCDYSANRRRLIRFHTAAVHLDRERCEVCFKTVSPRWLLQHYYLHTRERRFSCEVCGQKFVFHRGLKRHIESKHLDLTHDCNVCGKRFREFGSLVAHVRKAHTNEPSHICCVCSKPFFNKWEYVSHVDRVHIRGRSEKCAVCGKGFFTKTQLKNHAGAHTGEKPFSCETCGTAYVSKYGFKRHMKTHSKRRPFKCDRCGKAFKWEHNLASHVAGNHP